MGVIAFLRQLPRWAETVAILALAFGPFILSSLSYGGEAIVISAGDLYGLAAHEIIVGALVLGFLIVRGWRFSELGFTRGALADVRDTVLLYAATFLVSWGMWTLAKPYLPEPPTPNFDGAGVSIVGVVVFSLINAAFEEIFVAAYLINAWRTMPFWLLVSTSAFLRLSYHSYQGVWGVLLVLPMGLIFASYFAKRGRIAPLIAVHAALDVLAFLPYAR